MTTRKRVSIVLFLLFIISITFYKSYAKTIDEDSVFIKNGSRDKKQIAITFDDGPHPKETNQVLDVLKKYDIKATFFVAGKHAEWYSETLVRTSEEGHEIGNHTFNHPDISKLSDYQIKAEIVACDKMVFEKTGKKTKLFRPPYGSFNEARLEKIATDLDYKIVLWTTIDAKDWKNPSAQSIAKTITENAQNGDIILLHDYATNNTVEALNIFIPQMIKKGYEFVTVSELIDNL